MTSNEPPDDLDDGVNTPTIIEGLSFAQLRNELDDHDIANLRDFLVRVEEEVRRGRPGEPTRLAALGPFRDLVEVARGGMGVVYRAFDPKTGEAVAVKVPTPNLTPSPMARRMFEKEAEAVGRLDHPAVVPHRPVSEPGSRFYIVSAYCDGPDLAAWLNARRLPVPAREAARIVRDLAGGVAHAHSRGVLHRDVKPSNVLLPGSTVASDAQSLSPRLTDFGLAKLIDSTPTSHAATATGLVMGSPPYMAPEQASPGIRKPIGPRTDVYGLGSVLYELLTLRPPFRGDTPAETLGMVATDEPVPIRVLRPGVPRSLEAIALQCLEKDPDRRYPSADALRADLDAFLAGRRVKARGPGPIERLRRRARRQPRAAAAAISTLALLLALAAAAAAWTVALRRGRERADQLVYDSRVPLAQRALADGQLVRVQPILDGLLPGDDGRDRREFAWYHLWRLSRQEARMLLGADFAFEHLALSPDQSRLAAGGGDGMLVYDLVGEAPVWQAASPGAFVYARPGFSFDGSHVVFLLVDIEEGTARKRRVEVRRADSGALIGRRSLSIDSIVRSTSFLPDGRLRIILEAPTAEEPDACEIHVWSPLGALSEASPTRRLAGLYADSADGRRSVIAVADGRLGVAAGDGSSFTPLADARSTNVRSCRFSEDGRRVAVAYDGAGRTFLHNAEDGRRLQNFPSPATPTVEMAIQPGREAILLRTADHEVRLIDPSRDLDLLIFPPSAEAGVETKHVRFTPDGRFLLVHRSEFLGPDHIEIRSAEDGRRLGETPARYKETARSWEIRRGTRPELIYGLGRHCWRWEWSKTIAPASEDALKAHDAEAWSVAFSGNGAFMATSSDNEHERATIRLRTLDGRVVREWEDVDTTVADLAFSPDASWIVTAHLSDKRALRIRPTLGEGEVVSVELPDGEWARTVAADPVRPLVYVGGDRGTILAWDVARRQDAWRIMPPPGRRHSKTEDRVHALAVAPDGGRLAVADDRGVLRSLDSRSGVVVASYEARSPMLAAAYSPDGRVVAVGDQEGRIHFLAADTAKLLQVVSGDDCDLRSLAFSPDGRTLAAAGLGRVVRLWDPHTCEELLSLTGHDAQINCVAFSPDGETLASADHSGIVRFWRGPRPPRH